MKTWSPAARSVWGKTDRDSGEWLPLVCHLQDSAAVAGHLWDTWVPRIVRDRVAAHVGGVAEARTLLRWLAGVHDVGKATPAFAQMARDVQMGGLVDAMERQGLVSPTLGRAERVRHTVTGHVAVQDWLMDRWDYDAFRSRALASIVGAHHGSPPSEVDVEAAAKSRAMGGPDWARTRIELLDGMTELTGAGAVLDALRRVSLSLPALIDLSALVIMADWIASDESRFPYVVGQPTTTRMNDALESLDLSPPWAPQLPSSGTALFHARFPHLTDAEPSLLQIRAQAVAAECDQPPLMVIEAPTGSGKSEAALLAGETLASRFGAGGVFVGLPTMATSNAMFARVMRWVDAWPGEQDASMWLAHGKAALNDDFAGLVRTSRVQGIHDEEGTRAGVARVAGWLTGRKKGMLANVVVGTIDQVLMGALQARHLALRHLALSSKVVVVDEVHSADVHMRSFLVAMLRYFGAYGTPVVLLSATLPPLQRQMLTSAYQEGSAPIAGASQSGARRRSRRAPTNDQPTETSPAGPGPDDYPLVTCTTSTTRHHQVPFDGTSRDVRLEPLGDDLETLLNLIEGVLQDGGVVGVLRNTVGRAQTVYDAARARWGSDVELFHSRFLASDRAQRERALVDCLGPDGSNRPYRKVIVGTQVLEQSLDIDLDLLITDIAPVDLIVQRIGRLHRHHRPRPPALRQPRCLLTGVEMGQVPDIERGTRAIYGESTILRALTVLDPHLGGVPLILPRDGPLLVHHGYDPSLEAPAGWEQAWDRAQVSQTEREARSLERAGTFQVRPVQALSSLLGWVTTPSDDRSEEVGRAQVRDSEDGIEVIVVCRPARSTQLSLLPGDFPGAGEQIPIVPDDRNPITRKVAACTVGLPQALTHPGAWEQTVAELESCPEADDWQQSRWLAGQLVLALDEDLTTHLNGHLVTYTAERGLHITRLEEERNDE